MPSTLRVVLAVMFIICSASIYAAPRIINYQGYLTDENGEPVSGSHDLIFRIYGQSEGGDPLWEEEHLDVNVEGGIVNILLGASSRSPFPDDIFDYDNRYLAIAIDSGIELGPRTTFASVPYTFRAAKADTALATYQQITLPYSGVVTSTFPGFKVENYGSGAAFRGENHGSGKGAVFRSADDVAVNAHSNNSTAVRADTDAGIGVQALFSGITEARLATLNMGVRAYYQEQTESRLATETSGAIGEYVLANGERNAGTLGKSDAGVHGIARSDNGVGVYAEATGQNGTGLVAHAGQDGYAADLYGNLVIRKRVLGDIVIELGYGLDYSEGFDIADNEIIELGSVLVIDTESFGQLRVSDCEYDTRVAGIAAGANNLPSGVVLGSGFDTNVALAGRVYCLVDATEFAIQPGDLLTTSSRCGHAMKVTDSAKAQGAILGKAMQSIDKGKTGLILVLVSLQ